MRIGSNLSAIWAAVRAAEYSVAAHAQPPQSNDNTTAPYSDVARVEKSGTDADAGAGGQSKEHERDKKRRQPKQDPIIDGTVIYDRDGPRQFPLSGFDLDEIG